MPTSVLVPIRLRVDPGALMHRRDAISDALRVATGRALTRSREVVLIPRRGAATAAPLTPVFTWTGAAAGVIPAQTRREIEWIIHREIARSLTATSVDAVGGTSGNTTRGDRAAEPFAPGRFDEERETYIVPSYDRNGDDTEVAVERHPFSRPSDKQLRKWAKTAPPHAPVDLNALWPRLRSSDPFTSSLAALEMLWLVRAGDHDAVWVALKALRADDSGPTRALLGALQDFAHDDEQGFRAMLLELVDAARAEFKGALLRNENNVRFTIVETDPATEVNRHDLAVLGGAEIVALRIPQAAKLKMEWERERPGRARIVGLFQALASLRRELDRYLTDRPPPTVDQLIASLSVAPEIPQDTDPAAIALLRQTTGNLNRFAGIIMLSLGDGKQANAEFVYTLERDLIANQRWIVDTLTQVREIDRTLYLFQRVYGKDYDKQEEVKALRASRALYISKVADNPLPSERYIATLRQVADVHYREWFDRAANAKIAMWEPMCDKLGEALGHADTVQALTHDDYEQRRQEIITQLRAARHDLAKGKTLAGSARLAAINEVEQRIPLIGLRVSFVQLWQAAHATMRDIVEHNRGNSAAARAKMLAKLDETRGEISKEYETPTYYRYGAGPGNQLEMWKSRIEWVQRDIVTAEKEVAFLKITAALVITVASLGFGAPEGISIIVWTLGEAVVFAGALTIIDLATDKPVTLSGFAVDVATNFVVFGFLKVLNIGLLKVALKFPAGQTLSRLAVIFGGNYVGGTLSMALVQRFETGEWPENIAQFLALNALLNAIAGALIGPKMARAFQKVDALKAEANAVFARIVTQHRAWLADMDAVAARGLVTPAEFASFKARGVNVFADLERLFAELDKVAPDILASMNLSRETLRDFAARAEDIAIQIRAAHYDPQPGVKRLPAPSDVITSLVKTSGLTYEYNPNALATRPDKLMAQMKALGYLAEESGGVIKLLEAGTLQPRYLLVPGTPDVVPPSLAALVLPREQLSRAGLRVVREQSAVPPLEAKLVTIVATNPTAAKAILEGIGRRIAVGDVQKLQAINEFLDRGGSPRALGVMLGTGNRYGQIAAGDAILRLPTLQPDDMAAIEAILTLLGTGRRATDTLIGISRYGVNGAERSGVYTAIRDIIPQTISGLPDVLSALSSIDQNQNQGALGALLAAKRILADFPGARLDFEVEHLDGGRVIRITDIRVVLPDDDPRGYLLGEVKEYVDASRLRNARARKQFGRDVVLELKTPPPGNRAMARILWLVRTPANASPAALQAEKNALKASMRLAFDTDPILRIHPDRTALLAEFDQYFEQMLLFF